MQVRDRIKGFKRILSSELKPSPRNWRKHPQAQHDALRGVLAEIGIADAVLVREDEDGGYQLIDGHLRADVLPNQEMPVLILDVTADEADKILATHDPLAGMAEVDTQMLGELMMGLDVQNAELKTMLADLAEENDIDLFESGAEEDEEAGAEPPKLKSAGLDDLAPTAEEMEVLQGRRVLVECSGGKDSSAAACWCRKFLPDSMIELNFVDMGADFIGFGLFIREFAQWLGCKLSVLRASENVIDNILNKGKWPHFMFPFCQELLHEALDNHALQFAPEQVVIVRGGRKEESGPKKGNKTRWLKIERIADYKIFQPLYFSDKASSETVLEEVGAPTWDGYGRGLCRTACRICPGQKPRAYAAMRREFPDVWAELLKMQAILGPGAWQNRRGDEIPTFDELADHGEKQLADVAKKSAARKKNPPPKRAAGKKKRAPRKVKSG